MFRRFAVVAMLATVVTSFVAATPALADSVNGAIVVDRKECTESSTGVTCIDLHIVFNSTATPAGNFINTINQRVEMSFTGTGAFTGCNSSSFTSAQQHSLFQEVETQEAHSHNRGEFRFECFGFSFKCAFDVHTHFAQGQFQFTRFDFNCA